jgi:L-ascorbate metabolism protein UlaG (beta-lactamase superfamily)
MPNTITWYSHANFKIQTPSRTLFVDPFFDGNPAAPISGADITEADAVLITHDHGDHVGSAVDICTRTGAQLVAIVGTAEKLQQSGVPAGQIANGIGMNIGGTLDLGGVRVTMTQAFHSSESGAPTGYIITLEDGYTIYHAGDTGIFSSMELWGQLYSIDLALLPIGGVFTMDPAQAALACSLLGCRTVLPMHWGTFPVLEQSTAAFADELAARAPKTTLLSATIGEPLTLS